MKTQSTESYDPDLPCCQRCSNLSSLRPRQTLQSVKLNPREWQQHAVYRRGRYTRPCADHNPCSVLSMRFPCMLGCFGDGSLQTCVGPFSGPQPSKMLYCFQFRCRDCQLFFGESTHDKLLKLSTLVRGWGTSVRLLCMREGASRDALSLSVVPSPLCTKAYQSISFHVKCACSCCLGCMRKGLCLDAGSA